MNGTPNLRIVMRDDWIEVTITSYFAGFTLSYKFYPNGNVTVSECGTLIDGTFEVLPPEQVGIYSALSMIADISADNIWALEDN